MKKKTISIIGIERKVKAAWRVIVDNIMGENSCPKESYQTKYDKVHAVDYILIDQLETYIRLVGVPHRENLDELLWLAEKIRKFDAEHSGFLMGQVKPERWMFKMM